MQVMVFFSSLENAEAKILKGVSWVMVIKNMMLIKF